MSRPAAAFVDRDGTIIRDSGYLADPTGVHLLPRAAEAIARLNAAGVPAIVVTNQSGIGRGMYGEDDFRRVQAEVERRLAQVGASLDAVYFCPHDPGRTACDCRKPGLALYRRASREFGLALERAVFVGDRVRDVEPARECGGRGYLVMTGRLDRGAEIPPRCTKVADLWQAVGQALEDGGRRV